MSTHVSTMRFSCINARQNCCTIAAISLHNSTIEPTARTVIAQELRGEVENLRDGFGLKLDGASCKAYAEL